MDAKSLVIAAGLGLLAAGAADAVVQPDGEPFQVNDTVVNHQVDPVAAFAADGSALVVWENARLGVLARRLDAAGAAVGDDLVVIANGRMPELPGEGDVQLRSDPAVVALASGGWMVFWTEKHAHVRRDFFHNVTRVLDATVLAQRLAADGTRVGGPVPVAQRTAGLQAEPVAIALPDGVAVAWKRVGGSGAELAVRVIGRDGRPRGNEVAVGGGGPLVGAASLAAGYDGGFVLAYESGTPADLDAFARRFAADGRPLGPAFLVAGLAGNQRRPTVLPDGDGGYLAIWQGWTGEDRRSAIYGRFFDGEGVAAADAFRVSQGEGYAQLSPAAVRAGDGYLVTWRDYRDYADGAPFWGYGVVATQLDSTGREIGGESWINDVHVMRSAHNALAADGHGGFLALWEQGVGGRSVIVGRALQVD